MPTGARRDYDLTGSEGQRAVERGLAGAKWYATPVERTEMLALMQRTNARAAVDTAVWLALLVGSGWWLVATWMSWWSWPAAFVYGTLYGSSCDARWHECGHRTAFRSPAANLVVYHLASFMCLREPVSWRWSHNRHHADTIVVGRDPEIAYPRPPSFARTAAECFALLSAVAEFRKYFTNLFGRLTPTEATYVPPREARRAIFWGRVHLLVWAATIAIAIASRSWLPLLLVGLPSLYGRWMLVFFGTTQHAGLAEDVLDHRLNTRTVLMNPVFRFLYLNMNYHVEHHMFPAVPYRNLPRLHELVKDDYPAPYPNTWSAYRDILPAMRRQQQDLSYHLDPRPQLVQS